MLLAFCFIFLGGLETVIARFHSSKVDKISLWLFPTVYFSINLYYLGKGLRYRFLLINDKDSEAYKAQTNMESTMKHVKENETSSSSTSLGSKVDEDEIEVSSIELKNISRRGSRASVVQILQGVSSKKLQQDGAVGIKE